MRITTKVLLMVVTSIIVIMGVLSWLNAQRMEQIVSEQTDALLTSNLEFVARAINHNTFDTTRSSQIIASNPAISKALHLDMSMGINRILNDLVKIYPFYNYVMVVTPEGDVFAVNTNDNQGEKIASEELLGLSVSSKHGVYASTHQRNNCRKPCSRSLLATARQCAKSESVVCHACYKGNKDDWVGCGLLQLAGGIVELVGIPAQRTGVPG